MPIAVWTRTANVLVQRELESRAFWLSGLKAIFERDRFTGSFRFFVPDFSAIFKLTRSLGQASGGFAKEQVVIRQPTAKPS